MRVSDVMTQDLVTLPVDASVAMGLTRAQEHDLHHVLITTDDRLVGIACVCELRDQPRDTPLGKCVSRPPEVIAPDQSLDQAAERFVAKRVSCFPVCDGEKLVGVITRSDLRRNMVSGEKLPATFACAFCGSTRHVRPLHGDEALASCLECADRSVPSSAGLYEEGSKD